MKPLAFTAFLFMSFMINFGCSSKLEEQYDTTDSFKLPDDELLTLTQKQTFKYFWEGAEPNSGMARERYHVDGNYFDIFAKLIGVFERVQR